MAVVVRTEIDDGIAVVLIDNPPINAGSHEVRAGILAAVEEAGVSPSTEGVVLIGEGSTFIAGSDLREFGKPIADPQLPAVIAAIEACRKPVIAALHGAALGGGFELALGCDARVALAGTVVGLPEVTLGIIPGAGGTQRVPRLVGVPKAISMICSGERIPAETALALGLIDQVVPSELRRAAIALAKSRAGSKNRVRELAVPPADDAAVRAAAEAARRAGKNRPAVRAAIDAVLATQTKSFDAGLAEEREAFQQLRVSREARALRYGFFAERDALKHPELENATALPVKQVAVLGAGTMGSGIAIAALDGGLRVALIENDAVALGNGLERIRAYYAKRVDTAKLTAEEAKDREDRLTSSLDWCALREVDFIVEAVFEDLSVKQDVFRRLNEFARTDAVLASNTSYLDLDAIASVSERSHSVVGLHFFSPAQVMRLVEVVHGKATSPEAMATALQLAKRLRKIAVVSENAFGFIGNRIYAAYRRQCEYLLEEGASPEQVDAALEAFGFAMGPFAVADLSGLDIAWRMRQSIAGIRNPAHRYVEIPDRLCEANRLGQKTGAGYYRYAKNGAPRESDPEVTALIARARAAKAVEPRDFSDPEIVQRVLLAMVNEAALVLQESIARSASDIDVVLINGYGFPKWEGGPMFWAKEQTQTELDKQIDWLAEVSGPGFVRCDTSVLFSPSSQDGAKVGGA